MIRFKLRRFLTRRLPFSCENHLSQKTRMVLGESKMATIVEIALEIEERQKKVAALNEQLDVVDRDVRQKREAVEVAQLVLKTAERDFSERAKELSEAEDGLRRAYCGYYRVSTRARVKFRRDSDEDMCGETVLMKTKTDVREGACMRRAGHRPPCISWAGEAADADGVCCHCRIPNGGGHRADCIGTAPTDNEKAKNGDGQ